MAIEIPVVLEADPSGLQRIRSVATQASQTMERGFRRAQSAAYRLDRSINDAFDNSAIGRFRGQLEGALPAALQGFTGRVSNLGLVAGAAFGAILTGAMAAGEEVKKIQQIADQTGVSFQFAQTLDALGQMTGIGDAAGESMENFVEYLGEAQSGSAEFADRFEKNLGVALKNTDGSLRSTEDVLQDVSVALSKVEDQSLKAFYAAEIFGNSKAIKVFSQDLDAARQNLQDMNLILSGDSVDRLKDMNTAFAEFGQQTKIASQEFFSYFAPALADLARMGSSIVRVVMPAVNFVAKGLGAVLKFVSVGWNNLFALVEFGFNKMIAGAGRLVESFHNSINSILDGFNAFADKVNSKLGKNLILKIDTRLELDRGLLDPEMFDRRAENAAARIQDVWAEMEKFATKWDQREEKQFQKSKKRSSDLKSGITKQIIPKAIESVQSGPRAELESSTFMQNFDKLVQEHRDARLQAEKDDMNLILEAERQKMESIQKQKELVEAASDANDEYYFVRRLARLEEEKNAALGLASESAATRLRLEMQTQKEIADMTGEGFDMFANAARAAFGDSKALAVAEATMNGYLAIVNSMAWGAKIGGPIGAGIAGVAMGALQAAAVAKVAGVGFASGGFPTGANTQIQVNERGQEAVLNASATARLGRGTIDALNSGATLGGGASVSYSPTIQINGNASREDISSALSQDKRAFGAMITDLFQRGYAHA